MRHFFYWRPLHCFRSNLTNICNIHDVFSKFMRNLFQQASVIPNLQVENIADQPQQRAQGLGATNPPNRSEM